jgi:hypothetical protein
MSRYIYEPITIYISKEFKPTAFIWRKRLYRIIEILSWWREPGEWWNGESVRLFLRVNAECRTAGIYELCKSNKDWFMYSVLD